MYLACRQICEEYCGKLQSPSTTVMMPKSTQEYMCEGELPISMVWNNPQSQDAIVKYQTTQILPVNTGLACQIWRMPLPANCPNANSRKNSGMPANIIITMYGIMNAPEKNIGRFLC